MMKVGRLLVPWYRYPPFRKEGIGGLSVAVWELTRELAERGVTIDVLTPLGNEEETNDIQAGVSVISSKLGERFLRNQPLRKEERKFLDGYEAILSVANYAARTLQSYNQGRGRITRQIHTIGQDRGIDTYTSLKPTVSEYLKMVIARRRDRRLLQLLAGSKTICVSRCLKDTMQDSNLEYSKNLFTIPNGIQTGTFRPMDVGKEYDLLFVGRFQKAKGLDLLLRSLSLIHSTWGEAYKLGIVGEFTDEQRTFIVNSTPEAVRGWVVFLGTVQRENMPRIINSGKLVIVPSRYESFGLPALEAIACGIPVLATRVGGLPEIIDETVGTLVKPDDTQALASAIHTSIRDTSLAQRAAINGPVKARKYDWRVVAPQILQVLFP
ncbi:MAG TPA: glycosyltransferase family 4 protein [Candidatus Acidoferrum sp.]|nr:glycosyltransferase family 4 protein [Candidatus Acidoferrum sp.]